MTTTSITDSQQRAARVVGAVYLVAMAMSIFSESYIRGQIVVAGNAVATAQNLGAHALLFRVGIAAELATYVGTVALLAALYVILRPVSQPLAVFAAALRMVEAVICVVATLNNAEALRVLSGADYLQPLGSAQLQVLARLSISASGGGLNVAFIFLGLGSAVFALLWYRSGYIPRGLAGLGVFASLLLAAVSFAIVIFPAISSALSLSYMAPMFLFEVGMGLWLLFRGLRPAATPWAV